MMKLNGALGSHTESKEVAVRQDTVGLVSAMGHAAYSYLYIEEIADAAMKLGTGTMKLATVATESGGSALFGTGTDVLKECVKGGEGAAVAAGM